MRYIPHSGMDVATMLKSVGASSVDELFEQIPQSARFEKDLDLPAPMSEAELQEHLLELSRTNATSMVSFMGAGAYLHFVPSAVDQLLLRSEFYTAYTPYQPEIGQGTLQAIFEFQSTVCRILRMETSNASMYDGATAMVEAALMARRVTRRQGIVVSEGVHPEYLETLVTYLKALDGDDPKITKVKVDGRSGGTDLEALERAVDDDTACVVVGYPNFLGVVEPLGDIVKMGRGKGVKIITSTCDPYAFGVVAPPGEFDVDVATGEGQALAVPPSFGGPGLGLFAIKDDKKLVRQMPGRLVGQTVDTSGNTGYVLTLSTREQHIRREKATSNICTNHGLCALALVINASLLGKDGFARVSSNCLSLASYLKKAIGELPGFEISYDGPTFNEFAYTCKSGTAAQTLAHLEKTGILGGVDLGPFGFGDDKVLVAVTETLNRAKLDAYAEALSSL